MSVAPQLSSLRRRLLTWVSMLRSYSVSLRPSASSVSAARVTSLIYLTPIVAVILEYPMFGELPSLLSVAGIAITCLGVALVTWRARVAPPAATD